MASVLEKGTYTEWTYIFRKFLDPHGSHIANATLKERVTDEAQKYGLRNELLLGRGSCENSWRPTIKQNSLSLKAQPVLQVLLLWDPSMQTSWGLNKESDMHTQKHHSS